MRMSKSDFGKNSIAFLSRVPQSIMHAEEFHGRRIRRNSFHAFFPAICLFLTFAIPTAAVAVDGQAIFAEDTIGVFRLNLKAIHQLLLEKARSISAPENALLREVLVEIAKGQGKSDNQSNTPEALARQFQELEAKFTIKPTGGLWLGFGTRSFLKIVIEASLKPKEVWEFLAPTLSGDRKPNPLVLEEKHVQVAISTPPGQSEAFQIDLRPDGAMLGIFPPNFSSGAAKEWEFVTKSLSDPETYFVLEINGPRLLDALVKNGVPLPGSAALERGGPLRFFWKNQDQPALQADTAAPEGESPIKSLQRIRIQFSAKRLLVMGAMATPESKEFLTKVLASFVDGFKRGLDKGQGKMSPTQAVALEKLKRQMTLIDRGKWAGIIIEEKEPGTIMAASLAFIGGTAAVAVPNFRKAREEARKKACYANQRVILGAIEMYNMDNTPMLSSLDSGMFDEGGLLQKGGYIKSPIRKPEEKCLYKSIGDLSKDGHIECEFHGPVE